MTGLPGGSGGYAEYIIRKAAFVLFGITNPVIQQKVRRNNDFKELWVELNGEKVLHFAIAYGFRNIQTLVRMIKSKKCPFHYVEVMACPAGCNNGGGQIRPTVLTPKELLEKVEASYHSEVDVQEPEDNSTVTTIYKDWINGGVYSNTAKSIFHTQYHMIKKLDALNTQW